MRTDDIAKAKASDWRPERNQVLLAAVGKLGEEATRLVFRCLQARIYGLDGIDPDKGETNLTLLLDEIADVYACVRLLLERVPHNPTAMERRVHLQTALNRPGLDEIAREQEPEYDR